MKKQRFRLQQMVSYLPFILALLFVTCLGVNDLNAQKKERTRLKAYYEKLPTNEKVFSMILTSGKGKNTKGVAYAVINMETYLEDSTILLGNVETDSLGESMLYVEEGFEFPINEDGYAVVKFSYSGNDSLRASKREVEFKDLDIQLNPQIEDSIYYVNVTSTNLFEEAEPVEGLKLQVGVKRLYSTLFLGDVETDDEGKAVFEFPNDIPGDPNGNIQLVVRLSEDDDFGTVTKLAEASWGVPVDDRIVSSERSLYGDSAPLWMILAVGVILVGAWVHFLWAVYNVWGISRNA